MWIRSAFWLGAPKVGAEVSFRDAINLELVPALCKLPAVRGAKALWPERLEDRPPGIACQILVEFDGREGIDEMLASSGRRALRMRVVEVAKMFDGTISHIDYRVA